MPIYKDKKRNTWYFRVYIYDNLGVKKQKCRSGFKTKNEAKIEERIFLSNFEQKKDTFGNFITKNDNKNNIAASLTTYYFSYDNLQMSFQPLDLFKILIVIVIISIGVLRRSFVNT